MYYEISSFLQKCMFGPTTASALVYRDFQWSFWKTKKSGALLFWESKLENLMLKHRSINMVLLLPSVMKCCWRDFKNMLFWKRYNTSGITPYSSAEQALFLKAFRICLRVFRSFFVFFPAARLIMHYKSGIKYRSLIQMF